MIRKIIFNLVLIIASIQISQGAGKLSWFYVTYGIDMEYWIDANREISRIDEIPNYSETDEKPKTFQTIKAGGLYSFNQLLGLYFELPFYYNRVEPYQAQELSNGQRTEPQEIFALGDIALGVNLKSFQVLSATLLVKSPSYPIGENITYVRGPGSPWAGLGVVQIGLQISAKLKNHFLYASSDVVIFDPYESSEQNWVLPGDLSLFIQYVYDIKLSKKFHLKPWVYLNYSSYHWLSSTSPPDERLNIGPGGTLSWWLTGNSEISCSAFWTLYSMKQRGGVALPNTRAISLGIYYGIYH